MCGICGYIMTKNITQEELQIMNDSMIHRGPDDSGVEIYTSNNGYYIGMAHRRLSILDLSMRGHQPMHTTHNKNVTVVFNGEIYNFNELKKELTEYPFNSDCDTEVILAAYLKWGIKCVEKFNGMFAFALYDHDNCEMYLVRDRVGKKPLYYYTSRHGIIFASELKPFLLCPQCTCTINEQILGRFLYQQYINAPDTIFKDIYKLEPGTILKFHNGQINKENYWNVSSVYLANRNAYKDIGYNEAKNELTRLLNEATKRRMIADVPIGSFLSGGYDSSLISALASSMSSGPLKTFSIGFEEEQFNEAIYAKKISEYLGTDHTECYINENDMLNIVKEIPKYFDEPFADASQIPTMLVSKLSKEKVTVALTGDGGDEFFCGYGYYPTVKKIQTYDGFVGISNYVGKIPLISHSDNRFSYMVKMLAQNSNKETKTQFLNSSYQDIAEKMLMKTPDSYKYEFESIYNEDRWDVRRMLLDMDTYLPGDILCKVDRASMRHSLETRSPILDPKVIEYSFKLPHVFKFNKGEQKKILKDISYNLIPKTLLERPKRGFSVPVDKWLRGALKEQLLYFSRENYLKEQGYFNSEYTQKLIDEYLINGDKQNGKAYSRIIWPFYIFQQWYETYKDTIDNL